MSFPFVWPRDDYPSDLPDDVPTVVEDRLVSFVQKIDVDSVSVDVINHNKDEETWMATVYFHDGDLSEKQQKDLVHVSETVLDYESHGHGYTGDGNRFGVSFKYQP